MRALLTSPIAAALTVMVGLAPFAGAALARDQVVRVPTEDAEMAAAIDKARASLPEFWAALEKPAAGTEGFALKVRIVDKNEAEHFWLVDVAREGDGFAGTINNDPNIVKSVKLGQRYAFKEADITDWMFMRKGRIVGNETMRPLLKRLPPDQAKAYRQMLESP